MPLPAPNSDQPWPPAGYKSLLDEYTRYAALYGGDVAAMMALEKGKGSFWGRMSRLPSDRQSRLHVPLPADLAATSATLLFSEEPAVTIPEAHDEQPSEDAKKTEATLNETLELGDTFSRLIEAGETASAFGGVFLKVDCDTTVANFPFLSVVQPDSALPEWRYGFLHAVTLFKTVKTENQRVWRHIERHETVPVRQPWQPDGAPAGQGLVLHGLYEGTKDRLGKLVDLSALEETAGLKESRVMPYVGLGIRYVPNILPNRRRRGEPYGRSDFAGAEYLFDALDEVYNDWMREFRLAKARLIVPDAALQRRDGQAVFDVDQEVYATLKMPASAGLGITATQFNIRGEEFERAARNIGQMAVHHMGLALKGQGVYAEPGQVFTATQVVAQERRTMMNQQVRVRFWQPSLADLFEIMLIVRNWLIGLGEIKGEQVTVFRPDVKLADSLTPGPVELAQTAMAFRQAGFSNLKVAKEGMPGATPEEVNEEVARMEAEQGLTVPEPGLVQR